MKAKKYALRIDNVDNYLSELWVRVEKFDLKTFNQLIQNNLPN